MIRRIIIVVVGVLIVVLGRGAFYYHGFYTPPPAETLEYENIAIPPAPTSEFSDDASDNISEPEEKTVLIDLAHENNFEQDELNVLMLRLVARDMGIEFLGVEDDLEEELLGKEIEEKEAEEEEEEETEVEQEEPVGEEVEKETEPEEEPVKVESEEEVKEKLPPIAFIIASPQAEFSRDEKETVKEFVDNGGKLLLIDDPTRESKINSISIEFGVIFEPDYLYNLKENDINYRNIFISEFEDNEITAQLKKIVLYTAGSISSADGGIAFADQNTFSSLIESRERLSPIALDEEAIILAIHDLTFMTEPYNGAFDNNQLIANIAAWLSLPVAEEKAEDKEDQPG